MTEAADQTKLLKQLVGQAAAERVQSNTVLGLGTGSTTAFAIATIGERLRSGSLTNVRGIPTSFQASVLAKQHGIPLITLDDVDSIDLAIDGADEVDPQLNLIKGGGAAHTREKVVDALAKEFIVVVDQSKLVDRLGSTFALPVEVLPMAVAPVTRALIALGGKPDLRMGIRKDGPVITDQGNMVLDVTFENLSDPAELEKTINNIPGVLENGLFIGLATIVLVGEIKDGQPVVRQIP
ncbi:ribose-5-phosphate isomerase RpiA [Leptolyngbya sp. FACHB-261]|uniref:ribose-5-phosphate isomerase RpiA n=1 Tax=Leptolyngbya sp. FACHB-261 TaxID=2692806 RepID=UPI00168254B3|nr:ribose-5-phosphate isomerase RpiA [Leptolyngbya sp. FACHB-261]MBD2100590.1 ribose-5-phosphate isomerase RpiA [Leptolyngbya sp. FACHB-261]